MQRGNMKIFLLAVVGSLLFASNCRSQVPSVNISNTWTLPQDGFSVFYRFFRDKISWFEADAVCQFHHANLVKVDNDVRFDASRAFLNDLNVTENVWIGLMRAQSSKHFVWSDSKILDNESGYWAEIMPSMESALCAVIDPIRDFRWHSLRCGGPETASFLCELEVPQWASQCIIRGLPSLSIQYMADSATVELSRDCGVEGIKRITCNGKKDHNSMQNELMCSAERENISADNLMKTPAKPVDTPAKPIENADCCKHTNNENNNIDNFANQIEATIEKVGDKFVLDDVMMGDEPMPSEDKTTESSPNDENKPIKSLKKIAIEKPLKNYPKQLRKMKDGEALNKDDFMMGDQPIENVSERGEQTSTTETRIRRETTDAKSVDVTSTTESIVKVEVNASHAKVLHENNHFIPPMLLVQHQNATVSPHVAETTTIDNLKAEQSPTTNSPETSENGSVSNVPNPNSTNNQTSQETDATTPEPNNNQASSEASPTNTSESESSTTTSTTTQPSTITIHAHVPNEHTRTSHMMRPHAPKFGGEISFHAPVLASKNPAEIAATTQPTDSEAPSPNEMSSSATSENPAEINSNETATTKSSEQSSVTTPKETESVTNEATEPPIEVAKRSSSSTTDDHKHDKHDKHDKKDDLPRKHADFTNADADNFHRYKPARRRILTKPETHNYIQKIFG